MPSAQTYLTLSPHCSLRLLEEPCIYDRARDELYEIDPEASSFVRCLPLRAGSPQVEHADPKFIRFCLEEGLLRHSSECRPRKRARQGPLPSLRYLLLHITTRCNLECLHCFLGDVEPVDLAMDDIQGVMSEFDELQGLRLLVSGGEPLLHPQFWEINDLFKQYSFRTVILSNGTTLTDPDIAKRLRAHEVQLSLDGVGASHDALRGAGSFQKTLRALENLTEAGIDISVATMVHAGNISDFDALENIVRSAGAREWNIDVPSSTGRWRGKGALLADMREVGSILGRAFGGGVHHDEKSDWACGAHLCAVMADGTICKCGFYADSPSGRLSEGLEAGWRNIPRVRLAELRCDCEFVERCRGGCRYRAEAAGDRFGKDPIMCAANGLPCYPRGGGDVQ